MVNIALIILCIIFGLQLLGTKTRFEIFRSGFFGKLVFWISVIFIFSYAFYLSWDQYQLWKNDDIGKLLLPPYQNFDYIIFYARTRFFNPYILSLFFSLLFFWSAKSFNKKYEERFFEESETYIFATALFLVGHPNWLFYLILLLLTSVLLSAIHSIYFEPKKRLSLYYLWLPVAISTILISRWLEMLPWWQILKF
ncbi:MAG: hypothetical protein Q7S73_00025 [bacterium]|nr:hypothetical protein [bacterium]